ncbi:DNA polymerase II [Thermococcus gorgonarius]|uniref:DNA polymerase II small subunit n=2 Tax=Thermococcus gorgonarius TaxID=71997 RepID=A0A2Z2M8S6_THEGO|nr:DNA polymerase II [Thermococcus gorgonarius]
MLVEDLIKNRYLITPPAYYLLEPHYKKDFTLAELIKFAKSAGTFVIDLTLAEEFLKEKGLISGGATEEIENEESQMEEETGELTSVSSRDISLSQPDSVLQASESSPNEDSTGEVGGYISTGKPLQSGTFGTSSEVLEAYEDQNYGGESFVSTGIEDTENLHEDAVDGEISEDVPVEIPEEDDEDEVLLEPEPENEYLDYSNGENGNGDTSPRIVYGDYGIPIAYVEEEVPEEETKSYSVYSDVQITPKENFHYLAAKIEGDYAVVFDVKNVKLNPPKAKNASGKEGELLVEAYRSMFISRLRKMRRIFRENPEIGGIIDIGKLSYIRPDGEITVVGLVNSKKETSKGYVLEIEDATGTVKVFVNRDREDSKKVMEIMHDSVIAVTGRYSGRGMIFAERIYLPDVPKFRRKHEPLKEKVYAVLLSDIHVGSKKFCEEAFIKFLDWLNGDVENEAHAELVSRIKYMILGGDVVDGIGIYPGQYDELAIPDIFDQYEALANLLRNVPKHIHMFIGPGNHDAARTALPQPGFYEEYARPIFRLKNATIISNPAVIRLHGRDFLVAHGRGIEDVVNEIPNRSHHRPAEAMVNLLKLRHLAPTFGGKVPIAPDPDDLLVIESVPDLFQAGHVHVMEYRIYNGVFVINSGTWQAQTEFQKMVNIVPTPARVPIIDVETARLRAVIRFDQFCEGV